MQIRFLGTTEAEDQIVEVPDNVNRVEVTLPEQVTESRSPWPSIVFFIAFMVWTTALIWIFHD